MQSENGLLYLSDAEVKALLNAVAGTRDKAIIILLLNTGILRSELLALDLGSIDWDKKVLHVGGRRKRDLPLNEEVYEALSAWSRERPDGASEALFVNLKGMPHRLSTVSIDKLLRKSGFAAGIKKHLNARILRDTFGVRLLSKETAVDNASLIFGVTNFRTFDRYAKAARQEKEGVVPPQEMEKLDTRPPIVRKLSKLFFPGHKPARVIKPSAPVYEAGTTLGRDSVLAEIKHNLSKEHSTLLVGPLGIGKTHLLKVIADELNQCSPLPVKGEGPGVRVLYLSSPTPLKQFIQKLCDKYCPDWQQRLQAKSRASAKEIMDLLISTLKSNPPSPKPLLIIDNLDSIKSSEINMILELFDNFTILAAAEETGGSRKELWWKFRRIDLQPLDHAVSKELIRHLTAGLTITDYELLETRILTVSNGMPLAIVEMVDQVNHLPVINKQDAREVYHEAGIRYRDWSPFIIILWSVATSSRFINLGIQSFEGYILAVLGMAALLGGIRFLRTR